MLEWDVAIPDSEKVLGIADEFIDLSSRRVGDLPSREVWFASLDSATSFIQNARKTIPIVKVSDPVEEKEQDWMFLWRQHYSTQHISVDDQVELFVVPAWEEAPAKASGDSKRTPLIVKIEPGQAFGAGTHSTTRLCLLSLLGTMLRKKVSVVHDFGSGTGLLAIAAGALAKSKGNSLKIHATEIEDAARDLCNRNAELNGIAISISKVPPTDHLADITVANVLAPVLLEFRDYFFNSTKPGGTIILSGLLKEEANSFYDKFVRGYNSRVQSSTQSLDGEWVAVIIDLNA